MHPRSLTPDDASALLPLVQALAADHGHAPEATEHSLRRDLEEGWIWGHGLGDPLHAYLLAHPHMRVQFGERGVHFHHVYVHPDHRRRGAARALLQAAEAEAKARGCHYAIISAVPGNDAARAAYEDQGFVCRDAQFWRFRKVF
ncbi:MAG: GNAT family N-acetyltransferase [Pseudomonadota bacterium]